MPVPPARALPLLALLALAGCGGDTPETPAQRVAIGGSAQGPSQPIESPDVTGAVWAVAGADGQSLAYGKPGEAALLSIACRRDRFGPVLAYARHAHADAGAQAMLALIGNRRVERLFVDAARQGSASVWAGQVPAGDPRLAVLEGPGEVEATIPGAGSVKMHASPLPGALIARCRAAAAAAAVPSPQPPSPPTPSPPAGPR